MASGSHWAEGRPLPGILHCGDCYSMIRDPTVFMLYTQRKGTLRTVCRCRHSFSDQKCAVLYILNMISWSPPALPHPSSLIPLLPSQWEDEKLCEYVHFLVYYLVGPKTTTVPFDLNDVWSMLMPQCQSSQDRGQRFCFIQNFSCV
jgi:hypothetical protein